MTAAEKRTAWFTFGQGQAHHTAGMTFDPDVVVEITAEDPRAEMVRLFGTRWAMEYDEVPEQHYFPGGMVRAGGLAGFERIPWPGSELPPLDSSADDLAAICTERFGEWGIHTEGRNGEPFCFHPRNDPARGYTGDTMASAMLQALFAEARLAREADRGD